MIIQLPYIIEFPSCSQVSLTKYQLPKYCLMCNPNYAPKIFLQNSIKTKKFVKNRKTRNKFKLRRSQNRASDYKYLKIELHNSNNIYTLSRISAHLIINIWKSNFIIPIRFIHFLELEGRWLLVCEKALLQPFYSQERKIAQHSLPHSNFISNGRTDQR